VKFTSHEEYGLRCLVQIGRNRPEIVTINQISDAEGISPAYVAKLLRILRMGGFLTSARGLAGGYTLSQRPQEIVVGDVLAALGGRLFESDFCERHSGSETSCAHSVDCSLRSLWSSVQVAVDGVLRRTTLADLLRTEEEMRSLVREIGAASGAPARTPPADCVASASTGENAK
jgi:Rrf2 family protein